jgi:putative hydrolase of the HAD superfamily
MGGVMVPSSAHKVGKLVEEIFNIPVGLFTSKTLFIDELYELFETGKIDEKQFWQRYATKFSKPLPDLWPTIFPEALKRTSKIRHKMKKLVSNLKKSGIKTAVLSNVSEPYARRHFRLGHYQIFDYLILSHIVGIRKPDVRIYYHALSVVNVKPHESVFIDDLKENIEVAENLGMKGIVYKNTRQVWREVGRLIEDKFTMLA